METDKETQDDLPTQDLPDLPFTLPKPSKQEIYQEIYLTEDVNSKLAVLSARTTHGESVSGLLDTGASMTVVYSATVTKLRLSKHQGRTVKLQMADKKLTTTDEWTRLKLHVDGIGAVEAEAVVIPGGGGASTFDFIVGKREMSRWFGDITFRKDGGVEANIAGQVIELPCARRAETDVPAHAIVDLDAEGDSSVGEVPDDAIARAREALAGAEIPNKHRPAIRDMVDKLPGLVRRRVQPAVALDEKVKARTPKAEIKMKPDATPPAHPVMRMSQNMRMLLKRTIDELVEEKLLLPSTSPFATRAMLLPKQNGSGEYRFVADYRDLNAGVV